MNLDADIIFASQINTVFPHLVYYGVLKLKFSEVLNELFQWAPFFGNFIFYPIDKF